MQATVHIIHNEQEAAEGPNQSTVYHSRCGGWFPSDDYTNHVVEVDDFCYQFDHPDAKANPGDDLCTRCGLLAKVF